VGVGVAARDHLPFISPPYELSEQDPMLDGLAPGSSRDVMNIQGRALANEILTHIPGDTDCSDSCEIGSMNREGPAPAPGTKQFKYEIFWVGSSNPLVEVKAAEDTVPKPTINAHGNKIYDTANDSGVSIVFLLGTSALHTLETAEANNKPILAKDFKAAINDPDTIISSERVASNDSYAAARLYVKRVEWGDIGSMNVKSVSEDNINYPVRLKEVQDNGFAVLKSVEAAERAHPLTPQ
jgi:hypothetical protein